MNNYRKDILSVIVPVYKGELFLLELYRQIKDISAQPFQDFELIFVNDASPDNSWQLIMEICEKDPRVAGINFSRNFGQHYAISAGLEYATGEWIVVMDCDLQDRPEEIPALFKEAKNGYDIVLAQRLIRQDSFLKRLSSKCFYIIFSYLTDTHQDASIANFGIYNHRVIKAIISMHDCVRYFPAMVQWTGFRRTAIPVTHQSREHGKSSYSLKKLIDLALDNIIAFSYKPLKLTAGMGLIISVIAFLVALWYYILYMSGYIKVMGYMSIILSIWFLSGIIISIQGILGIYIGKIFNQVKQRPLFIIADRINLDDK
jgi:dolichol-phosphate mannosyltransferase